MNLCILCILWDCFGWLGHNNPMHNGTHHPIGCFDKYYRILRIWYNSVLVDTPTGYQLLPRCLWWCLNIGYMRQQTIRMYHMLLAVMSAFLPPLRRQIAQNIFLRSYPGRNLQPPPCFLQPHFVKRYNTWVFEQMLMFRNMPF